MLFRCQSKTDRFIGLARGHKVQFNELKKHCRGMITDGLSKWEPLIVCTHVNLFHRHNVGPHCCKPSGDELQELREVRRVAFRG